MQQRQRTATSRGTDAEPESSPVGGGLSLDGFLNHKTTGGSGAFLRNWREEGEIDIWVHPKSGFWPLWNHPWYKIEEVKDKATREPVLMVFSKRFNCHDPETILRKQRFREDDGAREYPPVVCPQCFMTDWFYREIVAGRLDWKEPVFKFTGDDPDQEMTLHAGGIVGMYGKKDITKDEIAELRKAGINRKDAWKESLLARCQYLLQAVDDSDPSAGVVKAIVAGALGDAFKRAVRNEIKAKGDKGDPTKRAYPFKLLFDDSKEFADKYDVIALSDRRPSAEVDEVLRAPCPDVSDETAKGNCAMLRAEMEAAALIELPFDDFFAAAEARGLMVQNDSPPKKPRAPEVRGKSASTEQDGEEDDDAPTASGDTSEKEAEVFACEFCDGDIAGDAVICERCKSTFDEKSGQIDGIPCVDCKTVVPLEGDGPDYICPSCAVIHTLAKTADEARPSGHRLDWAKKARTAAKEEPLPARRRARKPEAAAAETKATPRSAAGASPTVKPKSGGNPSNPGDDLPY